MDPQITQLQKEAAERPDVIGLAGGLPADELLPRDEVGRALAEVTASREDALQYGWPEGIEQVRDWIVTRLARRGATIPADRVIITAGAQQALSIAGTILKGTAIRVGDATYPGALDAFRRAGAIPQARDADVAYAMTGVANPIGRALALEPARLYIADEAYTELRFDGHVPRPLVADHPAWHIGTISKTIAPGLRVGWLIPPAHHHDEALEIKAATDLQTASITQAALGRMLQTLDYDALVARARTEYTRRADALVAALRAHVPVSFAEPEGGFSIWATTDLAGDELAFLRTALDEGVMVDPGSLFQVAPGETIAMRLSFSSAPPERIDEAARRLGRALDRFRRRC
jgi:2-aminoadipate transaminase